MKIFRKYASALMMLPMFAALTACSDDDTYTPADAPSNAQVYFAKELNGSTVALSKEAQSFDVEIHRENIKGDLKVAIKATQDEDGLFTIPAEVNFVDSASTALLTISYDPTKLDYDEGHVISLSLADSTLSTPYGDVETAFTALIPAPWSPWFTKKTEWVAAGHPADEWPLSETATTCTYTYIYCPFSSLSGPDPGLPIHYRVNLNDPSQAQFWIEHWAANVDLILDYDPQTHKISIPMNSIGISDEELGPFYMTDVSGWQQADYSRNYPCTYDPEAGLFQLSVAYVTADLRCYGYANNGPETIQVDGFYVPDYSAEPTFMGILTDKNAVPYAQIDVLFGVDVEKAVAYVVEASDDVDAVADALAAGDVEGVELVNGYNNIPLNDQTGELQVVVASIVEGKAVYSKAVKFEYYGGAKNPWTSLGMGYFTDDMILPLFGYEAEDFSVEIEESNENPGVYRLLAMYSAMAKDFGIESGSGNVVVNAEDPSAVYILPQPLELTIGQNGPFSISTDAGELVAEHGFDAVKEQLPNIFATLKDGVITFPVLEDKREDGTTISYQLWAVMNGSYYYAGRSGQFKIVLPNASAEVKAKAAADVRAKNFRARLTRKVAYERAGMRTHLRATMKTGKPVMKKGVKCLSL